MLEKESFSKFIVGGIMLILVGVIFIISLLLENKTQGISTEAQVSSALSTTLQKGMRNNSEVLALQKFLIEKKYYKGKADGNFGVETEQALMNFQKAYGIKPTGIFGGSWESLDGISMPPDDETNDCDADFSGDSLITVDDFLVFINEFGTSGEGVASDLDNYGVVAVSDLLIFINLFGQALVCSEITASISSNDLGDNVVQVDTYDITDGVEILRFDLESGQGDLSVSSIPVFLNVENPSYASNIQNIINSVYLSHNGEIIAEAEAVVQLNSQQAIVTFSGFDLVIDEGEEVELVVSADIEDIEQSSFHSGDSIRATVRPVDVDNIVVEDQDGDELSLSHKNGSATGGQVSFFDVGIFVTFVSSEVTNYVGDGSDNDTGEFEINFNVEAFGGTVYVSDTGLAATVSSQNINYLDNYLGGVFYRLTDSGVPTTTGLSSTITFTEDNGADLSANGHIELEEGEDTDITLTVARSNTGMGPTADGFYQLGLEAVSWDINDSLYDWNLYTVDLEEYETTNLFLD